MLIDLSALMSESDSLLTSTEAAEIQVKIEASSLIVDFQEETTRTMG